MTLCRVLEGASALTYIKKMCRLADARERPQCLRYQYVTCERGLALTLLTRVQRPSPL